MDKEEIKQLIADGHRFIDSYAGQQTLGFSTTGAILKSAFESITTHSEVGPDLLLGKILMILGLIRWTNLFLEI